MAPSPDDVRGEPVDEQKLEGDLPIKVNLQVIWPSLDDLYLSPSVRPRPGFSVAECGCDCGSKSGGGGGK